MLCSNSIPGRSKWAVDLLSRGALRSCLENKEQILCMTLFQL
jgi:hypothetical protein